MFAFANALLSLAAPVNEAALAQVPTTLKEWCAVKGPHTQVAALFDENAPLAADPELPTLKAWFEELAPKAHVRQMQMAGLC